jgi:eukaryotic-like serine/threonine-protein kinase
MAASTPAFDSTAPFAAAPRFDVRPGAQLGRYEFLRLLGRGGMGLVVAAHDSELDRQVAIKLVAGDDEQARRRLMREAQAMARLSHPNVVAVHDVIHFGDRAGIVMELIDGDDLATWLEAAPRSWRAIVAAFVQAARGLAAAHAAGLVHRDFKPSNALIDRTGVVRVSDFGLARAIREPPEASELDAALRGCPLDQTLTRTGALMGTPAYMAPEQHNGEPIDPRADQWALACSLYSALYGHRPFAGTSYEELSSAVTNGALRPESTDPPVPLAIRAAIRRALARHPADRFTTMHELIAALSAASHAGSRCGPVRMPACAGRRRVERRVEEFGLVLTTGLR